MIIIDSEIKVYKVLKNFNYKNFFYLNEHVKNGDIRCVPLATINKNDFVLGFDNFFKFIPVQVDSLHSSLYPEDMFRAIKISNVDFVVYNDQKFLLHSNNIYMPLTSIADGTKIYSINDFEDNYITNIKPFSSTKSVNALLFLTRFAVVLNKENVNTICY